MPTKKKKKKNSPCGMASMMPSRPSLQGGIRFPSEYDPEDDKEINEIGYQVKSRKVDREDFLS